MRHFLVESNRDSAVVLLANAVSAGFAPLAISLALTLIYLLCIPVANTSVNAAKSTGVALFQGDWALSQLCVFWIVPI